MNERKHPDNGSVNVLLFTQFLSNETGAFPIRISVDGA